MFNLEGTRHGGIAQLGEHLLCKQGVIGSSPIISTTECSKSGQSPVKRVRPEEEERRSERAFARRAEAKDAKSAPTKRSVESAAFGG